MGDIVYPKDPIVVAQWARQANAFRASLMGQLLAAPRDASPVGLLRNANGLIKGGIEACAALIDRASRNHELIEETQMATLDLIEVFVPTLAQLAFDYPDEASSYTVEIMLNVTALQRHESENIIVKLGEVLEDLGRLGAQTLTRVDPEHQEEWWLASAKLLMEFATDEDQRGLSRISETIHRSAIFDYSLGGTFRTLPRQTGTGSNERLGS